METENETIEEDNSPGTNAVRAAGATVGAGHSLLVLGEPCVGSGAEGWDTGKGNTAVTALGPGSSLLLVVDNDLSSGGPHLLDGVGVGVVGQTPAVGDTVGRHVG